METIASAVLCVGHEAKFGIKSRPNAGASTTVLTVVDVKVGTGSQQKGHSIGIN